MFKLLSLLILSLTSESFSSLSSPTYKHILDLSPRLEKSYALKLATNIDKVCDKYALNKRRFTAILYQESAFKMGVISSTGDYSISQIHHRTAAAFGFDLKRLLNDMEYALECGAIVLKDFKTRYGHKKDWYVMYNCGVKDINRDTCQRYKKSIEKLM